MLTPEPRLHRSQVDSLVPACFSQPHQRWADPASPVLGPPLGRPSPPIEEVLSTLENCSIALMLRDTEEDFAAGFELTGRFRGGSRSQRTLKHFRLAKVSLVGCPRGGRDGPGMQGPRHLNRAEGEAVRQAILHDLPSQRTVHGAITPTEPPGDHQVMTHAESTGQLTVSF